MIVFVISARIGRKIQFSRYLDERQIKTMMQSGFFEFGSHTHDLHTDSIAIFDAFGTASGNPVLQLLQRDLRMSSARFEAILGHRPDAIAWPYGKYNPAFTTLARQAGYKLHFTSSFGYNEPGANPYAIKRIPVTARDTAESVLKKVSGGQN
jgi:peptidoglycan/xylan/chitin deacetylase (PgdA/CDA1 family)